MKILLADGDGDQLDVTAYTLRRQGFSILEARDGTQALRRWREDRPDLVLLDVGLESLTGYEACRRIRQAGSTPVILLSAFHDDTHVVQGFEAGADDYVAKPFSPRQLAARVRAVLRRSGRSQPEETRELQLGDLLLDLESHVVRRAEEEISLTPLEFRLLSELARSSGRAVSATRLVEHAWGYGDGDVSLLKTHICHLRRKLHLGTAGPGSIRVVPGVGYRLEAPLPPEAAAPRHPPEPPLPEKAG